MSLIGAETFQWEDKDKRMNVMWKVPRNCKLNDNVIVKEDEYAVFYRDGKAMAYFDRPDRYALTSLNAPIVGKLIEALSGARQEASIVYLQKRALDGKFGSKQPYQFRDAEFGIVNLRLFGQFRYKVTGPENFVNEFVGTLNYSTSAEVEERIKEQIVILIYAVLGEMKGQGMGVADLAANLLNIEQGVLSKQADHFGQYGITIDKVSGLSISLPEEVQKAVDMRGSMNILGTDYMGYQTGYAMRDAANNTSGGAAAAGVGLGAGVGMGYAMVDSMRAAQGPKQQPFATGGAQAAGAAGAAGVAAGPKCPKCSAVAQPGAKFCPECGSKFAEAKPCHKCGAAVQGAKFCPECGAPQGERKCGCGASIAPGAKFCPECGKPAQ